MGDNGIIVRKGMIRDLPDLIDGGRMFYEYAELKEHGFNYNPGRFTEFLIQAMSSPQYCILIAERDGEFMGSIAGAMYPWFMDSHQSSVSEQWWWVSPDARGSAAGKLLMQGLEKWAVSKGASILSMAGFTEKRSKALARLYKMKGFIHLESSYTKDLKDGSN